MVRNLVTRVYFKNKEIKTKLKIYVEIWQKTGCHLNRVRINLINDSYWGKYFDNYIEAAKYRVNYKK